jgi:hypothetical protein
MAKLASHPSITSASRRINPSSFLFVLKIAAIWQHTEPYYGLTVKESRVKKRSTHEPFSRVSSSAVDSISNSSLTCQPLPASNKSLDKFYRNQMTNSLTTTRWTSNIRGNTVLLLLNFSEQRNLRDKQFQIACTRRTTKRRSWRIQTKSSFPTPYESGQAKFLR